MTEVVNSKLDEEAKALGIDDEPASGTDNLDDTTESDSTEETTETEVEKTEETEEKTAEETETSKEPETKVEDKKEETADKEPEKTQRTERPPKYIPIPKYQQEKQEWKDKEAKLLGEIENLKNAKTPEAKVEAEDEISKLAQELVTEEGRISPEALKKLLDTAAARALPKESLEKIEAAKKIADEQAEVAYFDNEWGKLSDSLKKQYPNASQAQLDEAKKQMKEVAHTEQFHKFPLDYVLFKNQKDFDTILHTLPGKTLESGQIKTYDKPEKNAFLDFDEENATPESVKQAEADLKAMSKGSTTVSVMRQGRPVKQK